MKKQKLFKAVDIVIYFNIIIFIGSSFIGIKDNLYMGLMFIFLGILNLLFIIMTVKLRKNYNENFLRKMELEFKTEAKMDSISKENLNHIKKQQLETRIEAEIIDKIPNAKVIRNAYIPKQDGNDSEIDLILICNQGIFIFECKNITGKIIGNWKDDQILVKHPGGKDYNIPNPINQNTVHYQHLKNILGMKNDIFRSIIVFGDLSYIESYKDVPYHAQICQLESLIKAIQKLANRFNTTLEDHMVISIYDNLIPYVQRTDERELKHIERLKKTPL
jgi:hypothetical protein